MTQSEPKTPTEDEVLAALRGEVPDDAGEIDPAPDAQEQDDTASTDEEDSPQGQPDESAEDAPEAGTESVEGKAKGTEKPLTRQEKEHQRLGKGWQQLNAEKEAVKREREAFAKEREEVERAKGEQARQRLRSPEPLRDERGFTAQDYEEAASRWKKDGSGDENAIEAALNVAQRLRSQERDAENETYRTAMQHVIRQNPELQNQASPLTMKTMELLNAAAKQRVNPYHHPDGYAQAVEHAKLAIRADSVPTLEKKLTELTKENQRLTKLVTPIRGGPSRLGGSAPNGAVPTEAEVEAALMQEDQRRWG